MATVYTNYANGRSIASYAGADLQGMPGQTIVQAFLDCSLQNLVGASSDTAVIWNVPAGVVVDWIAYEIVAAETTASTTFEVGDAGAAGGWIATGTSATATAGTYGLGVGSYAIATGSSATLGKLYTTATPIYLTSQVGTFVSFKAKFFIKCSFLA